MIILINAYYFLNFNREFPDRNHEKMLQCMLQAYESGSVVQGVKGLSPMIAVENFDLVYSFLIDYMHSALLGVMKLILELLLCSAFHKEEFYIGHSIDKLESKLRKLKVPKSINRPPYSIRNYSSWKATQFRDFLFYFGRYAFNGILKSKYFYNFLLFSKSIFTFSQEKIEENEFVEASKNLSDFVQNFEKLYGLSHMNFNVHIMIHIPKIVKLFGPLWAYSMFAYESKNGFVTKTISGTNQVLKELAQKYSVILEHQKSASLRKNYSERDSSIKLPKSKVCTDPCVLDIFENSEVLEYKFFVKNNIYYESENLQKNTLDCYIKLNSNLVAIIHKTIKYKEEIFVVIIKRFLITAEDGQYVFIQKIKSNEIQIYSATEIEEKLIYVNAYCVKIPNNVECD